VRKKDRTSGATRVGIVSRPLTKWGIEAMRRGATTALPPLVKVRTPAACSHAARFCCVRIEPSNRAPKHQRADRAEVESRMTGGVDPLCHGQKQLLDRPSCWRNFCYQPNLYQAAIAAVYVCGVGPGSSVCPGSTAPTTQWLDRMSAFGTKRTSVFILTMSGSDSKQTCLRFMSHSVTLTLCYL